jgi:toxin secretion/phage lysis holin
MEKIWRGIQTGIAAIGGVCAFFWGGLDNLFIALLVFAAVDYATGVLAAIIKKKLNSQIGFKGIAKKVFMFLIVGIANIVDVRLIQTGSGVRTATILFYIANEGVSLLENAARCGLPIPKRLKDILTQLHEKSEKEEEKKDD